jgi:hypothetical protein
MGILRKLPAARDQKAPRHPEVNQENETGSEPNNHILATSFDRDDSLVLELSLDNPRIEGARQAFVEDANGSERPAGEDRRQLAPDRLDLGKLRHAT